jgi:hypothetical protein
MMRSHFLKHFYYYVVALVLVLVYLWFWHPFNIGLGYPVGNLSGPHAGYQDAARNATLGVRTPPPCLRPHVLRPFTDNETI